MQVYSTSEQLLRWRQRTKDRKASPSPETRRDWGLEEEQGWQDGASEPGARWGPIYGLWTPAGQPGWGQGVAMG